MLDLTDILTYVVVIGFTFASLCAMTRGGRGWGWRLAGLGLLVGHSILLEKWWYFERMPFDPWLSAFFASCLALLFALVFALSRDSLGRRLFLSIDFGAYAACYISVFYAIVYRNVFGLPGKWPFVPGLVVVASANLAFVFWVLPRVPQDGRGFRWRGPCLAAAAVAASLVVSGIWPISIVTAPVRYCSAFVVASVVAWVVFPLLFRHMNDRLRSRAAEHSLELMMTEMKVRRAALDEARRIRHDQRHHRIVLGDLLLRGRMQEALEYLNGLDEGKLSSAAHVWCENETVNAILAGCSRKAAAKGVGFSAEAHVGRIAPLPDVELVSVVANLVENAIEACVGVKSKFEVEVEDRNLSSCAASPLGQHNEGEAVRSSTSTLDFDSSPRRSSPLVFASSPQVTCTLRQRGDRFGLTVTNPVPPDFRLSPSGLPCDAPGIGLGSVRQVVERHAGDWQYTVENGVLTCELVVS